MTNLNETEKQKLREDIALIRKQADEAKRRRWPTYKIDKHRDALEALREDGVNIPEMAAWLKLKGLSVSRSTISRSFRRWQKQRDGRDGHSAAPAGAGTVIETTRAAGP